MKSFLNSIKARSAQAQATLAKAKEMARLERAVLDTKTEFDRHSVRNQTHDPAKSAAHAAWSAATQAFEELRYELSAAEGVLRNCKPILSAHADVAAAHGTHAEARKAESAALAEVTNLQQLISELKGEIVDLGSKVKQALAAHGEASIAARLTGQQAPPTPKAITTLTIDLESRKGTLESAEAMLIKTEERRDLAKTSVEESRNCWTSARVQVATIEYHDAIATIAPQISMYLATSYGYPTKIEFAPEPEAIEAARQLLSAELERR